MYLVSAYSATKRLIEPDLHTVYAIGFVSYKSPRFRSFSLEIGVCVRSQYTSQMYSIAKWFSAFVVVVALPSQIDVHFIRIIFPCVHFMRECHWFLRFIVFEMTHAQQSWSLRKIGRLFPMSPPPPRSAAATGFLSLNKPAQSEYPSQFRNRMTFGLVAWPSESGSAATTFANMRAKWRKTRNQMTTTNIYADEISNADKSIAKKCLDRLSDYYESYAAIFLPNNCVYQKHSPIIFVFCCARHTRNIADFVRIVCAMRSAANITATRYIYAFYFVYLRLHYFSIGVFLRSATDSTLFHSLFIHFVRSLKAFGFYAMIN